eukprot:gnl/MRDRNA2_/MRDRNA2_35541_c0_seq1.p1 gnl/MRDRNA2_/MRDRNA2_35541_c0~~gnl/MRDRNA2_/MRDRNA2_35541_c0_seq1.p1  ORF type:complete len:208 (+),score=39.21 gnl/MRDRNA2_/MRDRNA2_35541_c0_seq1:124-747(+)
MTDEVDRTGGPCYNKNDRVRQEWQWRERVKEEVRHYSQNPNFQLNLIRPLPPVARIKHSHNRIELVTDKEHRESPATRACIGDFDENSFELRTIKHLNKKPAEKWDLPNTSSHEIGWLMAKPLKADNLNENLNSARSQTIPKLTAGKWVPPDADSEMKAPKELMSDIKTLNTPRWYRPKEKSDVSKYFDTYLTYLHHNPFSKSASSR